MLMNKRGATGIIFIIMIVVIALVIIFLLYSFIKSSELEKTQLSFNCISDVNIQIISACLKNNILNIEIKNQGDSILGNFFLIKFDYNDGSEEGIPTPCIYSILPYETKKIQIAIPKEKTIIKAKIIPRIEDQAFLCNQFAPEINEIKECEDGE